MKIHTLSFAASLFAVLAAGCSPEKKDAAPVQTLAEQKLPVSVQTVGTDVFTHIVRVQGTLESVHSALVSARIAGPLLSVDVDLGDRVEAGKSKLFAVDPVQVENRALIAKETLATAEAQVAVAEAQRQKAEAVSEKAQRDAERFSRLHADGRVSDNEQEQAGLQARTAAADLAIADASLQLSRQQVSQARAQLAIAQRDLSDATLFAPIDGIVNSRMKEPGERVAAGDAVIHINGVKELKALAFLPAQYYAAVEPGKTGVKLSVGGETLPGAVIAARSPAVNPKLRTFEIKVLVAGSEKAMPGAMADFEIVLEKREGLSVPETAILKRAAGSVVFVDAGNGTAAEKVVEVGLRTDGRAEILSGLSAGERVIVQGQTQLYDMRPITVQP